MLNGCMEDAEWTFNGFSVDTQWMLCGCFVDPPQTSYHDLRGFMDDYIDDSSTDDVINDNYTDVTYTNCEHSCCWGGR